MKKYCEKQGLGSFDWNEFLDQETYTYGEVKHATTLAGNWVTCAVGSQCDIIPRDEQGAPLDHQLRKLGNEFNRHVLCLLDGGNDSHFKIMAKTTLVAIELRSSELIREMGVSLNE